MPFYLRGHLGPIGYSHRIGGRPRRQTPESKAANRAYWRFMIPTIVILSILITWPVETFSAIGALLALIGVFYLARWLFYLARWFIRQWRAASQEEREAREALLELAEEERRAGRWDG